LDFKKFNFSYFSKKKSLASDETKSSPEKSLVRSLPKSRAL